MNRKITFSFLIIFLFSISACSTFEVSSFTVQSLSWEKIKVTNVSYKKGNETKSPISSIVKIAIPSENINYETKDFENIIIPDKKLGSKVAIEITVCATFQNDSFFGEETVERCSEKKIIYSSPKLVSCNNTPEISDLNKPTFDFKPVLKRPNFKNKDEYEVINDALEVDNARLLFSTADNTIAFSITEIGRNDLNTQNQALAVLKTAINKDLTVDNLAIVNSELQVRWKNKTQKWDKVSNEVYPNFTTLYRDRPMNNKLDKYESHYYRIYIPKNEFLDWELGEIGVATFKNFDNNPNLKVEVFRYEDLSERVSENTKSEVIYAHYNNETIYIKVSNKNNQPSNYGLAFHSIDHASIIAGEAFVNLLESLFFAKFGEFFGENMTTITRKAYLSGGNLEVALLNEVQSRMLAAMNLSIVPPFVIRSIKKIAKEISRHEDSYYRPENPIASNICNSIIKGNKVNIRSAPSVNSKVLIQGYYGDCVEVIDTKKSNKVSEKRILKKNTYFTMKGDTKKRFVINKGRAVDFIKNHNNQLSEIKIINAKGKKISGYTATEDLEQMNYAWYKVRFAEGGKVGWVYGKFVSRSAELASR